jgi:hypothetical protein
MKKRLNTEEIKNELVDSVFFTKAPAKEEKSPVDSIEPPAPRSIPAENPEIEELPEATMTPRHRDTMIPSNHDTTTGEVLDIEEIIRKAVKQIGKEAATYRFTEAEKQALADIEYTYKRQGIRTSGNEITRIGLNFLIADYHAHGEQSILGKILTLLNS